MSRDTSGMEDGLYEDEDTYLDAGRHGYILTDRRKKRQLWSHDRQYDSLREDEVLDLLNELRVPNRKKIARIIREHADTYPRYRLEGAIAKPKTAKLKTVKPEEVQRSSSAGCFQVLFWLAVIIGILYFVGSSL